MLKPLNGLVSVKVNEQIATATSLITRALHISVINPTNSASLLDVIVGEAKGGFDANVCNKDKQFEIPPGINGTVNGVSTVGNGLFGGNSGANGADHNGNIGSAADRPRRAAR